MCGITGWASFHHDARRQAPVIEAMTATLARRGPDAGGIWLGAHAALGHRRLSVLDLVGGAQPMADRAEHPQVVLSYSGEVYNHHQLRAELRRLGHEFRTRSDTEVVLRGYRQWGDALVDRLEGMYAFAIWDERRERLLLVRDRLGVKPLHWARIDGGLVFGSEPKALFAHPEVSPRVDAAGLREAYSLLFNTGPTIWAGVHEIPPGGLLALDRSGLTERRYWQLEARPHTDDQATTVERVHSLVDRAARAQLAADVPLCSLLSGGLDSTVITALAADELRRTEGPQARLRSYAVDYSDQAEQFTGDVLRTGHDTPFATEAGAFIGTDHSTVVLDPHALLDLEHRRAVVVARDSPIGVGDMDTSLYLLFGEIRAHSTVALSGEAADEVFGGYPWFHDPKALAARTFPWLLVTGDAAAMPLHPDLAATLRIGEFRADTYRDALAAVPHLDGEDPAEHRRRELQHLSLTRWLRQLLHRKDRLSMARGLEVRVPYCDHRLVEYVFNTPWAMKSYDGREKSLLRATAQGIAPESVLWRPKNHYPATHHPDYNRGLQRLAREALDVPQVRGIADERVIKTSLDTPPDQLPWGQRLRLERVVDLALWLDHHRPAITL
ncbi:asparagine synthase (glutamine-hydrolyzing) [Kitasatospora acidiphila]|uniref:asparagine synthase (glutamine-hydrolyzing) n=1 Tax=Kitasatospora acidiphila TaxID=2567942 RepID=A0A540WCS4_9ACTN|nr:asparagine synthase (glutamine-hydrolyzing) [Kitasatospora acidiphila]TQF06830.1 asparagine synthase (glutamine-hydrolyzing) [Kitasatospora acidiphila]